MQGLFEAGWFQLAVKIILSVVIVIVLAIICGLIIPRLQRRFRIALYRDHTIHINNHGNVNSFFYLTAESAEPLLTFQFFQNDIPLSEVLESAAPSTIGLQQPVASQSKIHNSDPTAVKDRVIPARMSSKSMASIQNAGKACEKIIAKTGAAASLLGMLGSLLPGSLGSSLKEQGNAIRGMQTKTKDIMDKPQAIQRQLDQVKKDTGKLGVKAPTPQIPAGDSTPPASNVQTENFGQAREDTLVKTSETVPAMIKYYCTGEVNPGETVALTLRIGSKKRTKPEGSFIYSIKSLQVPLEKLEKKIAPTAKQGMVNFSRVNVWRFFIADALCVLLILAGLLAALFGISLVW